MILSAIAYLASAAVIAAALRPQWCEMQTSRGWIAGAAFALGASACCIDPAPSPWERALHAIVLATMSVAATTDIATGLIYDRALLPACGLLVAVLALSGSLGEALVGAAISAAPFFFIYIVTRRRGMGLGDVKLAAVAGLGLGAPATFVWAGSSFVLGASWAIAGLLLGRVRRGQTVPFAPFMAAGVCVAVVLSEGRAWLIG